MAEQPISETLLLAKARAYCARQERCQQEVREGVHLVRASFRQRIEDRLHLGL
jgi:hypothetical protein